MVRLGLRTRLLLAVLGTCAVALVLAVFVGQRTLESVHTQLGTAFARNAAMLSKQRMLMPVNRELALAERFAGSVAVRDWFLDEGNAQKRDVFFKEAAGFQGDFSNQAYFAAPATSGNFYLNDRKLPYSTKPRYTVNSKEASDQWFFKTLRDTDRFNLNIDLDTKVNVANVWFNVIARDENNRKIGIAGTGLNLSGFLKDFLENTEAGVLPMIVDDAGAILAHPDANRIAHNAAAFDSVASDKTLFALLGSDADRAVAKGLLGAASRAPDSVQTGWLTVGGMQHLAALTYDPTLRWHFLNLVDLNTANVIDRSALLPIMAAITALFLTLAGAFALGVNRVVLQPLLALTKSARQVAKGEFDVALPAKSGDEIGELTGAFGRMVEQVRLHTDELEARVASRTKELSEANALMAQANKNISDSIEYASLIQRSILPIRQLQATLADDAFALWLPRDVVGGDFYVLRAFDDGYLVGVADCAGHGVPGACMTMLAHAVIENAIDTLGGTDPAAILRAVDAALRQAMATQPNRGEVATTMDMGLAYVDPARSKLTFAGAKTGLYWRNGNTIGTVKGGRRAIAERREFACENSVVDLEPGTVCYITTDGYLDQAGGEKGFSLGDTHFRTLISELASVPLPEQEGHLRTTLNEYRGTLPQRDDVTVVGFRVGKALAQPVTTARTLAATR